MEPSDWIALAGLIVVILGGLIGIFVAIGRFQQASITNRITVDNLNATLTEVRNSMIEIQKDLVGHDYKLSSHDERIRHLEDKVSV